MDGAVVDHIVHDVDDDGVVDVVAVRHGHGPVIPNSDAADDVVGGWIHMVDCYTLLNHEKLGPPNILLFDPCCCCRSEERRVGKECRP